MIPGIGGETAIFLAYGHAAQTSDERHKFGQGAIEGVIAPEAANNAKEGGALIPTIGLGVPGSALMAIFLGAFMLLGLYPGPGMLLKSMDIVLLIIWAMMLGAVIASLMAFLFGVPLVKLVYRLKSGWLAVSVVVLASYGVFVSRSLIIDLFILFIFGLVGIFMKFCNFPRASLLVGFVLGNLLERNTQQAYSLFGWDFFLQPVSLSILAVIIIGMIFSHRKKNNKTDEVHTGKSSALTFIVLFSFAMLYSFRLGVPSSIAPLIVSSVGLVASIIDFIKSKNKKPAVREFITHFDMPLIICTLLFLFGVYLLGFFMSAILFMFLFLLAIKKETLVACLSSTVIIISLLYTIGYLFEIELPEGLVALTFL
jgi:hypothetical protein